MRMLNYNVGGPQEALTHSAPKTQAQSDEWSPTVYLYTNGAVSNIIFHFK